MGKSNRIFYGWWVTLARLLIFFGLAASPFSVILKQLMNEFHTGRGAVSILPSISCIAGAICSYYVSTLMENHSARKFLLWGGVIGGISLLLCAAVNSLWQLYVLYFILGSGFNGIGGSVPLVVLISKWFNRKRGMAMGLAMAGLPTGMLIVTPIVGIIATHFGWRATYLFAGGLTLAISIPLILLIIKDSPQEMGLLPDGDVPVNVSNVTAPKATEKPADFTVEKPRLSAYLRSVPLWLICLGFTLMMIGEMAVVVHEVSFLTDMGISAVLAASTFGFTAGLSGLGRLASGWLADRISIRYLIMSLLAIEIIGVFILLRANSMSLVWLFVIVYGFASGSFFSLLPLVIRDIFGAKAYTILFGFVNSLFVVAQAVGAPLAGFIFDATGSYHWVFIVAIAFYLVAMISIYFAYGVKPRRLKVPQ
jgi:MFS family permease